MFDPYRKWLGIPPRDQPPNHYRLLGLELFESDLDVIEGAADKQMSFVRQYQSGEHATDAARILNELAIARLCLLKPATKATYDEKLRQEHAPPESELLDLPFSTDEPLSQPALKNRATGSFSSKKSSTQPLLIGGGIAIVVVGILAVLLFSGRPRPTADNSTKSALEIPKSDAPVGSGAKPVALAPTDTARSKPMVPSEPKPVVGSEPMTPPAKSEANASDPTVALHPSNPPSAADPKAGSPPSATTITPTPDPSPRSPDAAVSAKQDDWIDLLEWAEGVDWAPRGINWNDKIEGKATRDGIMTTRQRYVRFPLPVIIDGDYEMEVEFTRHEGDGDVAVYFPVGTHNMRLLLSAFSGQVSQVDFVAGKTAAERRPGPLTNHEPHRIVVRVRHAGEVAGFNIDLDNVKDYMKWEGPYPDMTNIDSSPWGITMLRHPWIGSWENRLEFRKVRLRMLSGTIRRDVITAADREQDLKNGFVRLVGETANAASVAHAQFVVNQIPLIWTSQTEIRWPMVTRDFKTCDDFYGVHAPSRVKCPIPARAKSFSVVGYNEGSRVAKYQILIDGKQVHDSGVTGVDIIKIDIPPKSSILELVTDTAGDGRYDHTYWCYPRFHAVAAEQVTDKMLDGKPGSFKFTIASGTAEFGVTHNQLSSPLKTHPVHFRDAQPCDEFVFAHATSTVTYQVPEGMRRFTAVGYNAMSHHVKFEVWADTKRLFESPLAGITPIDVKLPTGTKTIELKIQDLGDAYYDYSMWCYPRLHRR